MQLCRTGSAPAAWQKQNQPAELLKAAQTCSVVRDPFLGELSFRKQRLEHRKQDACRSNKQENEGHRTGKEHGEAFTGVKSMFKK